METKTPIHTFTGDVPFSFPADMLLDLLDSTTLVIYLKDTEGRYLFINRRYAEVAGVPRETILGRIDRDLFPEPVARLFKEQDQQVIAHGEQLEFEETIPLPSGVLSFITIKVPLRNSAGEIYGVGGFCTDITSRDPGETETLAAERERLAVTFRCIAEAVISTDIEGRILTVNRAAEGLLEATQAQLYGKSPVTLPPLAGLGPDPVGDLIKAGRDQNFGGISYQDSTGQEKRVEITAAVVDDRSGSAIGSVFSIRDVTERARMEQELNHARRLEALGIFAAGLAHDFNNLMTIVLGNLDMVSRSQQNPEVMNRYLEKSRKALNNARTLTGQLQTYAVGGVPDRKRIDPGQLIRDVSQVALSESTVEYNLQIAPDIWQIEGDSIQLRQVFQNLLLNARQSMGDTGRIDVILKNHEGLMEINGEERRHRAVEFVICDQGAGIPDSLQEKIFDPYFTTRKEGTGLGLAVAYSIVTRHQGTISARNLPDGGACFHVVLPAILDSAPSEQIDSE